MRTCNPEALLSEASPAALLYPPCQLTASGRVQMPNIYFVYILASRSLTLYTGVTNGLLNRVSQHHQGLIPGFAATYRIFRLVYFEKFTDVRAAIARERQIKGYRREKKIRLIEFKNPQWNDLAEDSFPPKPPMHTEAGRAQTLEANLKQVPR